MNKLQVSVKNKRKTDHIWFWKGVEHKIPLCCIMFFETAWVNYVKNEIDEYYNTMIKLTNNQGIILCPDCLIQQIHNSSRRVSG